MLQVRSAQTPFQMRKKSFDLTWGAWAGILAVMTAVGAAFSGSQILMMYPRPVTTIDFKYPSLDKASVEASYRFDDNTPALFWSQGSFFVGRISDLISPVRAEDLLIKNAPDGFVRLELQELMDWCRRNLDSPIRHVAIGQSFKKGTEISFEKINEVVKKFETINASLYGAVGLRPSVVPIELANPF